MERLFTTNYEKIVDRLLRKSKRRKGEGEKDDEGFPEQEYAAPENPGVNVGQREFSTVEIESRGKQWMEFVSWVMKNKMTIIRVSAIAGATIVTIAGARKMVRRILKDNPDAQFGTFNNPLPVEPEVYDGTEAVEGVFLLGDSIEFDDGGQQALAIRGKGDVVLDPVRHLPLTSQGVASFTTIAVEEDFLEGAEGPGYTIALAVSPIVDTEFDSGMYLDQPVVFTASQEEIVDLFEQFLACYLGVEGAEGQTKGFETVEEAIEHYQGQGFAFPAWLLERDGGEPANIL